jgi:hypothetical protein
LITGESPLGVVIDGAAEAHRRFLDVRSDRPEHLSGDGAVAGLGECRERFGEVGRDACRNRDSALPVYRVYFAHALCFG